MRTLRNRLGALALLISQCTSPTSTSAARRIINIVKTTGNRLMDFLTPGISHLGLGRLRNHASLFPCTSGTPGESGWPDRTNGGSIANLSYGASHNSFSPDPTAPPEPGSPAQRFAATRPRRLPQQHRAHHPGKDQSRFPLWGSSLSEGNPPLAQIPRAFRAARFRV